ncbi:MAG TPA: hypothetical protein VFW96_15410 [Thermomicrobiales bacterium]|nr:hypothetical protein [Thermomicrobiales bacterium]
MKMKVPSLHDRPPTGLTTQAVLGFLMPFILILITAIITYFVIRLAV